MWLTQLALKYPVTTTLLAIMIAIIGAVSFRETPVDLLPNISVPTVTVLTYYTGAAPMDVEQTVTRPIERAVSSLNDVDYIQSFAREGISSTRIFFNYDADLNSSVTDAIQRVNRILPSLPPGITNPVVIKFDPTQLPVCNLSVSGEMSSREIRDLAFNVIQPQIEQINGVASAQVQGGQIRQINVLVDKNRIESLKLPIATVLDAVSKSNLILPGGSIKAGDFDYSLRTESQFSVVEPMKNIVIAQRNGVPIFVRDVATIIDSYEEETQMLRVDGRNGITLRVQKTSGANSIDIVDRILKALPTLRGVPAALDVRLVSDQSRYIRQSVEHLRTEGLIGGILAIIIILVFLQNIRATAIIAVAIPVSLLVTFIVFYFAGYSFNIMTLGGLALGIGRLVDDSIVELEVIERRYHTKRAGESFIEATLRAAREVANPILISTLTTVIVFLPVLYLQGITKYLFTPLSVTIAVALFGSFFVSRTLTPLLCYRFLANRPQSTTGLGASLRRMAQKMFDGIDNIYSGILSWTLGHRAIIIVSVGVFCLASLGIFRWVGSEFFPDQDESQLTVQTKLPVGTRLEETAAFTQKIEEIIRTEVGSDLQAVVAEIGVPSARSGNLFGQNSGSHSANIQVTLVAPDERKQSVFEIIKRLRPKLTKFPEAKIVMNPGGFLRFLLNFGSSGPIDVEIRGYDITESNHLAQQIYGIVRSVSGATDVQITRESNLPEIRIAINREKAGSLGLSASQIASNITTSINGSTASIFTDQQTGNQYNIVVRLEEDYRAHLEDLKTLPIQTQTGDIVQLGNVVDLVESTAPVQIDRKRQQRTVSVTANVQGRDLGSVAADIQHELSGIHIPPGFELRLTGNVEQQSKAFSGLYLAFALAIVLVYIVMASQFQSLIEPFIILMTVPLGIAGVAWMLFLTDTTLSITSFQGIIVMVGIVVSNGVLLIDYANHLRLSGLSSYDSIHTAGRTRLKPILMTALATVLGLIPIAMGVGGKSAQAPLAIAVIGGLTLSTILTLALVPALYLTFEKMVHRDPNHRLNREQEVEEAVKMINS